MNYDLSCPICYTNLEDFNTYGSFYCKCKPSKDYQICSGIYVHMRKNYLECDFELCFKNTNFAFRKNNLTVSSLKPPEFNFSTLKFNIDHLFNESMYNRNYLSLDYVHDLYQIIKKIENNMVFL